MLVSIIAAMSENRVIGKHNKLPWHLPEELKYFKKITSGKPIIMGRKTFESMGSKPLPNRQNIILTQDPNFVAPQCVVAHSVEEALSKVLSTEEVMIIGGAHIYQLFLPMASRLYLTVVHIQVTGDTFFPALEPSDWELVEADPGVDFTTQVFDRKKSVPIL